MLEVVAGITLVVLLMFDIFQSVLVPRYTPASARITPFLVSRMGWPAFRSISRFIKTEESVDIFLGAFASSAFLLVFVLWLSLIIFSFALVIHGLGNEFKPVVTDFGTALYLAGTSLLTIGFGDIVSVSMPGRTVLLAAGTTGISICAIAVSFLFSMQQSVQSREIFVHANQARISAHSSGLHLLLNYADLGITSQLVSQIHEWERWLSEVLTSHRSFPLLCYFRSGHMSVPWITVAGILMDAANLMSTTISERRFAHAEFFLKLGIKTLNIFSTYFGLRHGRLLVSREEFHVGYLLLRERGYELYDEESAFKNFSMMRGLYAPALSALSYNFVCPLPSFLTEDQNLAEKTGMSPKIATLLGR